METPDTAKEWPAGHRASARPYETALSEVENYFGSIRVFSANDCLQLGHLAVSNIMKSTIPLRPVTSSRIERQLAVVGMAVLAAFDLAFGLANVRRVNRDDLDPRASKQLITVKAAL